MVELKIMEVYDNSFIDHNLEFGDEVIVLQEGYNGDESVMVCWHPERNIIQLVHNFDLLFRKYGGWIENRTLEDGTDAVLVMEDDGCKIFVFNTKDGTKIKKVEVEGNANENN